MTDVPVEGGPVLPEPVRRKLIETAGIKVEGLREANESQRAHLMVGIDGRGHVVLEFGRAIRHLTLKTKDARAIGQELIRRAIQAEGSIITRIGLPPKEQR